MEMEKEKREEVAGGDVKERDNIYVVELEMDGFKKEEIKVYFNDGYLVVVAESEEIQGKYMRQAFYVGRSVAHENIRAAFHNGLLKCMIPKDEKKERQEPVEIEIL
ncbi:MAG: Hsp20 family protein [Lachnospiraceae bacterium]|nr:Hsp20 family protein [Lachnospiraceae bacterium]